MTISNGDIKELLEQYKADFPADYKERLMQQLEIALARVELFKGALMLNGNDTGGNDAA